jgi:hypothetical protein
MEHLQIISKYPAVRALLEAPSLPQLGPGPRPGVTRMDDLKGRLSEFFKHHPVPAKNQELIRGAVYLWHDHMDASHTISQAIETPDGSLLHGILHRREPDYSNSKYWLRRVGEHGAYPVISERVRDLLLKAGEQKLAEKLTPRGKWDAFAFVDACEKYAPAQEQLLREIQEIEFEAVLQTFLEK